MIVRSNRRLLSISLLLILPLLLFGLTACQEYLLGEPVVTTGPTQHPFSMRTESSNGLIVRWEGMLDGHRPGRTSQFDFLLQNESDAPWPGKYCIHLVDRQGVIAGLVERDFNLEAGVGEAYPLDLTFPEDLAADRYGLVLTVQQPDGPIVDLVYIRIGPPPADSPNRPPEVINIPQSVVQTARAMCLPAQAEGGRPGEAAEEVVLLFYNWYLDYAQPHPQTGERRNPLVERAYRGSDYLADSFVQIVDQQLAGDEIRYDPFLCAQDVPANIAISETTLLPEAALVSVQSGLGNSFEVTVEPREGQWRITGVRCMP